MSDFHLPETYYDPPDADDSLDDPDLDEGAFCEWCGRVLDVDGICHNKDCPGPEERDPYPDREFPTAAND